MRPVPNRRRRGRESQKKEKVGGKEGGGKKVRGEREEKKRKESLGPNNDGFHGWLRPSFFLFVPSVCSFSSPYLGCI